MYFNEVRMYRFLYFLYFLSSFKPRITDFQRNMYLLYVGLIDVLPINLKILYIFDDRLYHDIIENYSYIQSRIKKSIMQFIIYLLPGDTEKLYHRLKSTTIGFFNMFSIEKISSVNLMNFNKLISFTGVLINKSDLFIYCKKLNMCCLACKNEFLYETDLSYNRISYTCQNNRCKKKNKFDIFIKKEDINDIFFGKIFVNESVNDPLLFSYIKCIFLSKQFLIINMNQTYTFIGNILPRLDCVKNLNKVTNEMEFRNNNLKKISFYFKICNTQNLMVVDEFHTTLKQFLQKSRKCFLFFNNNSNFRINFIYYIFNSRSFLREVSYTVRKIILLNLIMGFTRTFQNNKSTINKFLLLITGQNTIQKAQILKGISHSIKNSHFIDWNLRNSFDKVCMLKNNDLLIHKFKFMRVNNISNFNSIILVSRFNLYSIINVSKIVEIFEYPVLLEEYLTNNYISWSKGLIVTTKHNITTSHIFNMDKNNNTLLFYFFLKFTFVLSLSQKFRDLRTIYKTYNDETFSNHSNKFNFIAIQNFLHLASNHKPTFSRKAKIELITSFKKERLLLGKYNLNYVTKLGYLSLKSLNNIIDLSIAISQGCFRKRVLACHVIEALKLHSENFLFYNITIHRKKFRRVKNDMIHNKITNHSNNYKIICTHTKYLSRIISFFGHWEIKYLRLCLNSINSKFRDFKSYEYQHVDCTSSFLERTTNIRHKISLNYLSLYYLNYLSEC